MNMKILAIASTASLLSLFAFGADPCDQNCIIKNGESIATSKIVQYLKTQNPSQDTSCPTDGSLNYSSVTQGQGTLMNTENTVKSLIESVAPRAIQLKADASHCGGCVQKNIVSIYSTSIPANTRFAAQCSSMPTNTLEKDFNYKLEIASYINNTLRGNNQDGQFLSNQCPSPCSFYITSAQTPAANNHEHLTLTVQCNQPRAGNFLAIASAPYNYNVGILHSWTCSQH